MNKADYSRKISERQWNLPDKGELEAERENTFIDDIVGAIAASAASRFAHRWVK